MEKFSESIDPDKLPVPLVPPLPLIPRRPESGLGRHRSVPDISQLSDPDKDGWYWSKEWTTVKNIQSQAKRSEPIVDKKQLLDNLPKPILQTFFTYFQIICYINIIDYFM